MSTRAKFRADRFATIYVVSPIERLLQSSHGRIPILMYHSVSASRSEGIHPYYETATAPQVFERHMSFLRENGYQSLSLRQAAKALQNPGTDGLKQVVITFDDGYEDFFTNAFPIMAHYGYFPTVFLPTGYIGQTVRKFKERNCLSWPQIRELRSAGVAFGSHTVTHRQLRTLSKNKIREELITSKCRIEDALSSNVESFSYPYAFPQADRRFVQTLRELLADTGYENGVSTVIGTAGQDEDRYFMKRLPVNTCDDAMLFKAKLNGAYDWISYPQYWLKIAKGIFNSASILVN